MHAAHAQEGVTQFGKLTGYSVDWSLPINDSVITLISLNEGKYTLTVTGRQGQSDRRGDCGALQRSPTLVPYRTTRRRPKGSRLSRTPAERFPISKYAWSRTAG